MTTDMLEKLRAAKDRADSSEIDRKNYAAYISDRIEAGWSAEDVAEYKAEVGRIMTEGSDDEKSAAREFWAHKRSGNSHIGINERIRASIAAEKLEAA